MTEVEHSTGMWSTRDGTELFYHRWTSESREAKAAFIGVHGAFAHAGDFERPAQYFVSRGIDIFAFDLRGFGHWKGSAAHISDYQQYLDDIKLFLDFIKPKTKATKFFLMGHSMGGLLTLSFLIHEPKADIEGAIISSPWIETAARINPIIRFLGKIFAVVYPKFAAPADINLNDLTHDQEIIAIHQKDIEKGLRKTKATAGWLKQIERAQQLVKQNASVISKPILILQAGDDRLVRSSATKEVFDKIDSSDKEFKEYPGLYHELFNEVERGQVFNDIWNWLEPRIT